MKYELLQNQIQGFAQADSWYLPLFSNAAAAIYHSVPDLNWAGFYLVRNDRLVLGPFQGKPACIHIAKGKGVCGTAWEQDRVLRVADVHSFPGHIACDCASASEIVLPIHRDGKVAAVLDIDSPLVDRFCEEDEAGLLALVQILEGVCIWE